MERVGPWAHCARCDAPVKRITTWVDPENAQLVITVDCHGERETVRVSQEFMLAGETSLRDWVAFQYEQPSLPADTSAPVYRSPQTC